MIDNLVNMLEHMDGVSQVEREHCDMWDGVECVFRVGDDSAPVAARQYADGSIVIVTFFAKGYRQREVRRDAAAWEVCEAMAVAAFRRVNPRQGVEVVYALEAV